MTGATRYITRANQVRIGRYVLYIVVSGLGVLFMFPFFWTASSSLKTVAELFAYPPKWVPRVPQFNNYVRIFEVVPFAPWLVNTVVLVALTTLGRVISCAIVGYSFARFQFRGKDLIFMLTLGTMMLPSQVTLIPQYVLFHKLGWLNTLRPLWVPAWFGGGAFSIFLMRQFISTLPTELDEAAVIDGASYLRVFTQILLPLCMPALATVAVISFIGVWNDFMGPLVYLNSPEKYTIAVGLQFFKTGGGIGEEGEPLEHIMMAATVLSVIPCLIIFFSVQRFFVRGIAMTGIKG